jgi:hypothetical protein
MIRQAKVEDIQKLIPVLRDLHRNSPYAYLEEDETAAKKMLAFAIGSKRMFLWVSELEGKIVGFLLGATDHIAFPVKGQQASDIMFYVQEGNDGYRLAKKFLKWGWEQPGVRLVGLSVSSGIPRSDEFIGRLGLQRVGGTYLQFPKENNHE